MAKKKVEEVLDKPKKGAGRPCHYTEELGDAICAAVSKDVDGLKKILAKYEKYPSADTVNEWRYKYPEFNKKFRLAQSQQAELRIEEAYIIAEDTSRDMYINKDGVEVPNPVTIARDRLRIDTRKYMASKLAAALYGDKMQNEVTVIRHEDTIDALK